MSAQNSVVSKPCAMPKLSEFYLACGILTNFAPRLYEAGSREDRSHLLILDNQSDLHAPEELVTNWPVGIIRVYKEVHLSDLGANEKTAVFPSRVGVNFNSVGYSEGVVMDRDGILAFEQHLAEAKKGLVLQGFYLALDEVAQLSMVPSLGSWESFEEIDSLINLVPEGILDGFHKRQIREYFAKFALVNELSEEELQALHGLGRQYINWEFANAVIAATSITAMQSRVAAQADAQLSGNDEAAFLAAGAPSSEEPSAESRGYLNTSTAPVEGDVVPEATSQLQLAMQEARESKPYSQPGVQVVDVEAEIASDYQGRINHILMEMVGSGLFTAEHISKVFAADQTLMNTLVLDAPMSMRMSLSQEGFEYLVNFLSINGYLSPGGIFSEAYTSGCESLDDDIMHEYLEKLAKDLNESLDDNTVGYALEVVKDISFYISRIIAALKVSH